MRARFTDRREAGRALGEALTALDTSQPLVLALPRGGVPVADEVARTLGCPLDVLMVRKLGVPFHPELAMGAVSEGGTVIRNDDVIVSARIDERTFARAAERELAELDRRVASYRRAVPALDPEGKTAIIVDDGLATGSTARAAVEVARARRATEVWLAVPVAPAETASAMEAVADRVVALETPRFFGAVGAWFGDFAQIGDDEVRALLTEARYGDRPTDER